MDKLTYPPKYCMIFAAAFLIILAGVACAPVASAPAPTPIIQVVQVNREVTKVVIQEVTRIVEVPVTITPTPTLVDTDTPTPNSVNTDTPTPMAVSTNTPISTSSGAASTTLTPISGLPAVTVLVHTQCLYGPDSAYLSKYELLAASQQVVIGRNQDSTWLYVQGSDHKNPCWVKAVLASVDSGSISDMPVTVPVLSPYSSLYPPPPAVSANRVGNDVTIFWLPIQMTEADYHGYLIEAWVCQGGQLVLVPNSYVTTFDDSKPMLAVKVTDEPGCLEPSHARISTVNNQGYSTPKQVPSWPAAMTPTPTLTPTP